MTRFLATGTRKGRSAKCRAPSAHGRRQSHSKFGVPVRAGSLCHSEEPGDEESAFAPQKADPSAPPQDDIVGRRLPGAGRLQVKFAAAHEVVTLRVRTDETALVVDELGVADRTELPPIVLFVLLIQLGEMVLLRHVLF